MDSDERLGYSRKTKQGRGVLRTNFFYNSPGIFHFFALHLKIPDKGKVDAKRSTTENSTKLCQLHPSEIPRPKTRPPGNSTLFFLLHPSWKLHLVFNLPNSTCYFFDIPGNSISSPHLPVPPPCCFFFLEQPIVSVAVKMKLYMVGRRQSLW